MQKILDLYKNCLKIFIKTRNYETLKRFLWQGKKGLRTQTQEEKQITG